MTEELKNSLKTIYTDLANKFANKCKNERGKKPNEIEGAMEILNLIKTLENTYNIKFENL